MHLSDEREFWLSLSLSHFPAPVFAGDVGFKRKLRGIPAKYFSFNNNTCKVDDYINGLGRNFLMCGPSWLRRPFARQRRGFWRMSAGRVYGAVHPVSVSPMDVFANFSAPARAIRPLLEGSDALPLRRGADLGAHVHQDLTTQVGSLPSLRMALQRHLPRSSASLPTHGPPVHVRPRGHARVPCRSQEHP